MKPMGADRWQSPDGRYTAVIVDPHPHRGSRLRASPEEAAMAFLAAVVGASMVLAQVQPGSVAALLPPPLAVGWGVLFALAGMGIIGGMVAQSWRWELAGLRMMGFATAAYALAVLVVGGLGAAAAGAIIVGYSAACWVRSRALVRLVRQAQAVAAYEAVLDNEEADGGPAADGRA